MKSWNEIRKAATAFAKRWKDAHDEKSQAQSFLKEFFAEFGVDAVTVATFEHRVKFSDGSQGYADCFWQGKILVEMKSRGKGLDAAFRQAMDYLYDSLRTCAKEEEVKAVDWRGDESQFSTRMHGDVSPDYYANVRNAFMSAPTLAQTCTSLPGVKIQLAHSLGNMLVSAAKQDHGLQYSKYFMLNAAVPVEAYDVAEGVTAESKAGMTHPSWTDYPDRVRASHWWELFPVGDGRRTLTWKGRFANVTNTVNYFSSEEEVLANGNGVVPTVGRLKSWFRQEVTKGIKSAPLVTGRNEAGWEFNAAHMTEPVVIYPPAGSGGNPTVIEESRLLTPSETATLTDAVLMSNPFFGHFQDHNIYLSSNGQIVATNAAYRAQLLADAIPAESFAVGANSVPAWGDEDKDKCNVNMIRFKDKDRFCHSSCQNWIHSLFLGAPYVCIHEVYENIVSRIPKESGQ